MSTVYTGTAGDYNGLLSALVSALVASGWTNVATDTTSVPGETFQYLSGPGAGGDQIFCGIRSFSNPGLDYYNWQARGFVSYNGGLPWSAQPGVSPAVNIPLWQYAIPYKIIVNGRRFILIAKISTTFFTLHYGYLWQYATSAEMPYPVYLGGSASGEFRWSAENYNLGSFWDPPKSAAYIRHFDGSWVNVANFDSNGQSNRLPMADSNVWPWADDFLIGRNKDASYSMFPAVVHSNFGGGNVYGEIEGVYFVSGFANAAEDTIPIGGIDHLVVQSAYRTDRRAYAAIKLG